MVKSSQSFVKIGPYLNFQSPPLIPTPPPPAYLILPNVPTPSHIRTPRLFRTQEYKDIYLLSKGHFFFEQFQRRSIKRPGGKKTSEKTRGKKYAYGLLMRMVSEMRQFK